MAKKKKTVTKKLAPIKQKSELEKLESQLELANEELKQTRLFFEQVEKFATIVAGAKTKLELLNSKELTLKNELDVVRTELRSLKNLISSSNDGMLSLIEPGPANFLPLFDRMEKAEPKTHGKNSMVWREEPIAVLRLSPVASNALTSADILFIGQLQDRIVGDRENWWKEIDGLTEAIALAVADKLDDFAKKGGES